MFGADTQRTKALTTAFEHVPVCDRTVRLELKTDRDRITPRLRHSRGDSARACPIIGTNSLNPGSRGKDAT
jgi:hypothetical protein